MNILFVYTFYRFITLKDPKKSKDTINSFFKSKSIKGTILIAGEGINGSLSGSKKDLDESIKFLKSHLNIRKLIIKVNKVDFLPFNKLRIRLKKEIVSLGKGKININKYSGELVHPKYWKKIISKKNIKLIDVRNEFEISIGKFKGAMNPNTKSFREFPASLKKMNIKKSDTIAMYCTGGIRCEKASAYLKIIGYKNIFQLDGGIIKYLNYYKNDRKKNILWEGECFVFDNRVTINKQLHKGKYLQCYGCRRPITNEETKSIFYQKGVTCPYCYSERSLAQKNKSLQRQKQKDLANMK